MFQHVKASLIFGLLLLVSGEPTSAQSIASPIVVTEFNATVKNPDNPRGNFVITDVNNLYGQGFNAPLEANLLAAVLLTNSGDPSAGMGQFDPVTGTFSINWSVIAFGSVFRNSTAGPIEVGSLYVWGTFPEAGTLTPQPDGSFFGVAKEIHPVALATATSKQASPKPPPPNSPAPGPPATQTTDSHNVTSTETINVTIGKSGAAPASAAPQTIGKSGAAQASAASAIEPVQGSFTSGSTVTFTLPPELGGLTQTGNISGTFSGFVQSGGGCTGNPLTALTGAWVFSVHGFTGPFVPFADAGTFVASIGTRSGNTIGILSITSTNSSNGSITRLETDTGTYQIFPDCSGGTLTFNLSSRPLTFDFWFSADRNTIRIVSTQNGYTLRGIATRGSTTCVAGRNPLFGLSDTWLFSTEGFSPVPQPFDAAGTFVVSIVPNGPALTITSTSDVGTSVTRQELDAGTYQIFPDCSGGSLTFNLSSHPLMFDFWFKNGGTGMYLISTTNGSVVWGSAAP